MDAVVRKALAKRPDERYQTAEEFAAALRAAGQPQPLPPTPRVPAATRRNAAPPTRRVARRRSRRDAHAARQRPRRRRRRRSSPVDENVAAPRDKVAGDGHRGRRRRRRHRARRGRCGSLFQRSAGDGAKVAKAPARRRCTGRRAAAPPRAAPRRRPRRPRRRPIPASVTIAAEGLVDPSDPALQRRQGAAAIRPARRRQGPARREGARASWSIPNSLAKNYDDRPRQAARAKRQLHLDRRRGERAAARQGRPHVDDDAGGRQRPGAAEVAEPDVARRAHRVHPRERRSQDLGAHRRARRRPAQRAAAALAGRREPAQGAHQDVRLPHLVGRRQPRRPEDRTPTSSVLGEVQIKKLSTRLEASGIVVTKYALTSWTVKCIDRATGEEIYFNTTLPKGVGSWASEGEALKAIGGEDRRRVLAQLLPAARHRDRPQGRAARRRPARTPPRTTRCCASSSACPPSSPRAPRAEREAARLRPAARGQRRRRRPRRRPAC